MYRGALQPGLTMAAAESRLEGVHLLQPARICGGPTPETSARRGRHGEPRGARPDC